MTTWLAPEIEVTIGDRTRLGTVQRLEVVAARSEPVATAFLELSNVRFEWQDGAADGDPLVLRWGYRGQELQPLFDGTVQRAHLRETLSVWGLCRARALMDTRVTRTYQDEGADAVVRHIVAGCGFASLDIAGCATIVDKLPLQDNTLVEGLGFLACRLGLEHTAFADPTGGFHWAPPDWAQGPVATFTEGEDVLEVISLPGGGQRITVMGAPLWHSTVVDLVHRDRRVTRAFVERVRHRVGTLTQGVLTGKGIPEVARDIGRVVQDKDAFRRAGKTVFKSAQQRATLIARTETLRAHNEGRMAFYRAVGVTKVQWITAEDERTCPTCAPLDGSILEFESGPTPPLHANCRCTVAAYRLSKIESNLAT